VNQIITKDPKNRNVGTERGRRATERSFQELGAGRSILLDKNGVVIAGNKSIDAFTKAMGREPIIAKIGDEGADEADIIIVGTEGEKLVAVQRDDLDLESTDDFRARDLGIADNRTATLGLKWSLDDLREDWESGRVDYLFSRADKLRIDEEMNKDVLRSRRDIQDDAKLDALEEIQEHWGTELGQVWALGDHRMIIGSSTVLGESDKIFLKVTNGEKANILQCSPPYFLNKSYDTVMTLEGVNEFIESFAEVAKEIVSEDFGRIVINTGLGALHRANPSMPMEYTMLGGRYQDAFREHGWYVRHVRVWYKLGGTTRPSFNIVRSPIADVVLPAHEEIIFLTNSEPTPNYIMTMYKDGAEQRGSNKIPDNWIYSSVWELPVHRTGDMKHVAAQPIELAERYILSYSLPDEIIVDPFLGSGTTLLAAEKYGRRCIGFELDPTFASACLERYSVATGDQPELL